jgi:hypothetical protein
MSPTTLTTKSLFAAPIGMELLQTLLNSIYASTIRESHCQLDKPLWTTLYSRRDNGVIIKLMRAISIRDPWSKIKWTRTNRCSGHVLIGGRRGFRSSVRWVESESALCDFITRYMRTGKIKRPWCWILHSSKYLPSKS